jgi:hypothetical protein
MNCKKSTFFIYYSIFYICELVNWETNQPIPQLTNKLIKYGVQMSILRKDMA